MSGTSTGRLQGKIAIITGAAQGIGRATAELFAREAATVYATDINRPEPAFDDRMINFSTMDVANEAHWQKLVGEIVERHAAIDILVNNAGIGGSVLPLAEETLESWNRVIAVNQTGVFLGMRAVLPNMRARRKGSIVNISSIWGNVAVAYAAGYHGTKAAVRQLTKHAAVTYAPDNVRVNSVHPGIIATPMTLSGHSDESRAVVIADTPLGRMGLPSELANGILFLASDEASFVTGAELAIDGGYLAQ
jgi:NAD(P)-dependent dehydrogenase (short-subunit alcohol dehydrogenase family)